PKLRPGGMQLAERRGILYSRRLAWRKGSDAGNHSAAGWDWGRSGNLTPTGPRLDPLQDRRRRTAELCAAGGNGSGTGGGRSILFFGHPLGARPRVSPLFVDGCSATVARGSALSALGGVGQLWLRRSPIHLL